jgi:hypothetical protein
MVIGTTNGCLINSERRKHPVPTGIAKMETLVEHQKVADQR